MSTTSSIDPDRCSGSYAPLPRESPRRIYAMGLTYPEHVRETASTSGGGPEVFLKSPASWLAKGSAVSSPCSDALIEALERVEPGIGAALARRVGFLPAMLDYEVELGVVLLDAMSSADLEGTTKPLSLGFFVAGDITARSCQILGEGQADAMAYWGVSKSFPGFLPVHPTMWSPSEPAADPRLAVNIATYVNGTLRQSANTSQLVYGTRRMLLEVARRFGALERGDVVLTGTPSGVAFTVAAWKKRLADRLLDRFGKLSAAIGAYRTSDKFLWPGDTLVFDAGMIGRRVLTITT